MSMLPRAFLHFVQVGLGVVLFHCLEMMSYGRDMRPASHGIVVSGFRLPAMILS